MRGALHAEWTKLRTVPSTWWLLVAVAALTWVLGAAATGTVSTDQCPSPDECQEDTVRLSLTGVWLGQAAVAAFGVLAMSSEYGTGTIQATLTAVPGRVRVLTAKAVVVTGGALAAGIVAVLGSLFVGRLILPGNGFSAAPLSLAEGPALRAAVGTVLYLGLIALLALGVAAVVRDTAGAITTVLALLYALPALVELLGNEDWRERIREWAPASAGLAVQATKNLDALPIGPWSGLAVLGAWAGAGLVAGAAMFKFRDA
ncbi:ABC transporter permease [Streptomyces sp. NPDC058653]|uniref:ABC transporter permease n=1 Tax=Streptomyces sp. NPDC058653 TaxID=3346576 RepID=UPI00365BCD6D